MAAPLKMLITMRLRTASRSCEWWRSRQHRTSAYIMLELSEAVVAVAVEVVAAAVVGVLAKCMGLCHSYVRCRAMRFW